MRIYNCQFCGSTALGYHAAVCFLASNARDDRWDLEVITQIEREAKRHYDTMFDCDHGFVEDALILGAAER